MKLRILDYLTDIKEINGVAFSAKLQCSCGSTKFAFFHTGKQTKGILAPYIIKKDNQLALKAKCSKCKNEIVAYDSLIDGANPKVAKESREFTPFVIPKSQEFEVIIKYNYLPENITESGEYSNRFENCFIYLLENHKEAKALIEE
jgi:hypothetical protein